MRFQAHRDLLIFIKQFATHRAILLISELFRARPNGAGPVIAGLRLAEYRYRRHVVTSPRLRRRR